MERKIGAVESRLLEALIKGDMQELEHGSWVIVQASSGGRFGPGMPTVVGPFTAQPAAMEMRDLLHAQALGAAPEFREAHGDPVTHIATLWAPDDAL